jgi:hypothetical protein
VALRQQARVVAGKRQRTADDPADDASEGALVEVEAEAEEAEAGEAPNADL